VSIDLTELEARLRGRQARDAEGERWAAVAALLRETPSGPEVLFIRRAEHPGDPWSGHMAFPGGRRDPEDPDLAFTAERETREELGLDLRHVARPLGRLDDVPTHRRGLVVRPYVYRLEVPDAPPLKPNYEVASTHWAEVAPLMRGERDTTYAFDWKGQPQRFPGYDVEGRVVWGLTYRMMQLLFGITREDR
jgi:8-oxo-dGTP pyrophosphatase MutT (NUDIX family)